MIIILSLLSLSFIAKIRAHELRSKTKTELQSQLKELKEELAALR